MKVVGPGSEFVERNTHLARCQYTSNLAHHRFKAAQVRSSFKDKREIVPKVVPDIVVSIYLYRESDDAVLLRRADDEPSAQLGIVDDVSRDVIALGSFSRDRMSHSTIPLMQPTKFPLGPGVAASHVSRLRRPRRVGED